eukprot:scaffold16494_cov83-Cyclotella_meneghiniana.AAC.3
MIIALPAITSRPYRVSSLVDTVAHTIVFSLSGQRRRRAFNVSIVAAVYAAVHVPLLLLSPA